jgi:hypothetical protein
MIGVDDYQDEDKGFEPDTDIHALHYAIVRLRLSDVFDFARSYHGLTLQWQAFRGALLKGVVYQADIQAFLSNPRKRIADVHLQHHGFDEWTYNYVESESSLAGLRIDWSTMTAYWPPGTSDIQKESVRSFLMHGADPPEFRGRLAAYRRTWFGRIIDRYRGSRTKVIFVRLPRGPIPRPDGLDVKLTSSIRELARRPNVLLCDEHAFESLERPEFFKDGLHLNLEGATRFSHMLAWEVKRLVSR